MPLRTDLGQVVDRGRFTRDGFTRHVDELRQMERETDWLLAYLGITEEDVRGLQRYEPMQISERGRDVRAPSSAEVDHQRGTAEIWVGDKGHRRPVVRLGQWGESQRQEPLPPPAVTPPTITPISDDTIQAPNAYTGPTPTLDAGDTPVSWELITGPSGMTINASTGVVSWGTSVAQATAYPITIRATNAGGSDDESWFLHVTAAALSPVIVPISDASTCEGSSYTGPTPSLSAGSGVTWTLDQGPSGMTINGSTGVVSWNPAVYSATPHAIVIRATNSAGSDTEDWTLTVGQAPVIQAIPDFTVREGLAVTGPVPVLTQGTGTITWTLEAGPGSINSSTGQWSWGSPTVGSHLITIRATNACGHDDEISTLTVTATGGGAVAPTIAAIADDEVQETEDYTGPIPTVTGTGPFTFTLQAGPSGMTIDAATGVVSYPDASNTGSPHTVTIRATGPTALTDDETWILTVDPILVSQGYAGHGAHEFTPAADADIPEYGEHITRLWSAYSISRAHLFRAAGVEFDRWWNAHGNGSTAPVCITGTNTAGHVIIRDAGGNPVQYNDYETQMPVLANLQDAATQAILLNALDSLFATAAATMDGAKIDNASGIPMSVSGLFTATPGNISNANWKVAMKSYIENVRDLAITHFGDPRRVMFNLGLTVYLNAEGRAWAATLPEDIVFEVENIDLIRGSNALAVIDFCRTLPNDLIFIARQLSLAQFASQAVHNALAAFAVCAAAGKIRDGEPRRFWLCIQPSSGRDLSTGYPAMETTDAAIVALESYLGAASNGANSRGIVTDGGTVTFNAGSSTVAPTGVWP